MFVPIKHIKVAGPRFNSMLMQKGLPSIVTKTNCSDQNKNFFFFLFYFVQLSKIKLSCDRRFQHTVAFSKRADLIASLIWGPRGGRCTKV